MWRIRPQKHTYEISCGDDLKIALSLKTKKPYGYTSKSIKTGFGRLMFFGNLLVAIAKLMLEARPTQHSLLPGIYVKVDFE